MSVEIAELCQQVAAFLKTKGHAAHFLQAGKPSSLYFKYLDPCAYFTHVLKIPYITPQQAEVSRALHQPPFRVLAPSGHSTGKTFIAAANANHWFDTFPDSIVLTTAPTERQVKDLLWKEIRGQRRAAGLGGFIGPREPRMEVHEKHFAQGFTARDANAFQGHHGPYMLIIFDEAQGVEPLFWDAMRSMLSGIKWAFLAIYNPIGQAARVFKEETNKNYRVIRMSALDHPNIVAELQGLPAPVPSAIHLSDIRIMLEDWADKVSPEERSDGDICLGGQWWRLSPVGDARIAGRWPRQAVNSVWPAALFDDAVARRLTDAGILQIGCDVARFGDNNTAIHVRKGFVSLAHETHNGWTTTQTTERLCVLAQEYATKYKNERIAPKLVPIAVDDTGVGGGVVDQGRAKGFNFIPINAAWQCEGLADRYPNLRSALWFGVADNARKGNLSLARLPKHVIERLREQCCMQKYEMDSKARRCCWGKDKQKDETSVSPDDADAFNLSYMDLSFVESRVVGQITVPG